MVTYAPPSANDFVARLADAPCCAAIVSDATLDAALASRVPILFILRGNGLLLGATVRRAHDARKLVAAHLDLIDGVRADAAGVSWLARSGVDAIITSHGQLISVIRQEGAVAVERLLLSRRSHLDGALSAISRSDPDIVEILRGVVLPSVAHLMPGFRVPVLAGGFVRTEADVRAILAAGAVGVTTSSANLWTFNG